MTTDFGLSDPFVGVMKGVILSINPEAAIVDLTHQIQAQNVNHGAFLLGTSHRFFPAGAIHAVVVDPGVGTSRQALLLVTPHGKFLAPDNGVLSYVVADYLEQPPAQAERIAVPATLKAYGLNNPKYWLQPVSNTFHGRDIFAPVAAHLSLGILPDALGERMQELAWLPAPRSTVEGDRVLGEVIHVDWFGNLVTNIPEDALPAGRNLEVLIKTRRIIGLSRTYHESDRHSKADLIALVGSQSHLEIALPSGSAAVFLGASVGEPVQVTLGRRD